MLRQPEGRGRAHRAQQAALRPDWQRILIGIIILATVLRIGSALLQGNDVDSLPGIHDQISYDELARRVLDGYGFTFDHDHWPATRAGEPTAHWSFLYTLFLSAVYGILEPRPLYARILQALIAGVLHTWLAWRVGGRVFGRPVGTLAAALTAVYAYFVYYAGALITETFYVISILWVFDCALRLLSRSHTAEPSAAFRKNGWLWLELGAAIGITVLLRQLFLLLVPFLFLWLWWALWRGSAFPAELRRRAAGPVLLGSVLSGIVVVAMIVPWTIRNQRAFDTFVPLNTNSGFAFYWGNHPFHGTNFIPILPDGGPTYYDLLPKELLYLSEAELDKALLGLGLQFVVEDPGRYVLLSASRVREYFKFWPSPESSRTSNLARVASFGILLPFMLYGLWVTVRIGMRPRSADQQSAVVLLLGYCFAYTAIHVLTWTLVRYRIPVDAVLVIIAAAGMVDLLMRIRSRIGSVSAAQPYWWHSAPA